MRPTRGYKTILKVASSLILILIIVPSGIAEVWRGQFFYWSSQTCSRIRRLFVCRCLLSPCSKTSKLPYFRLFRPIPKYFLPLLPYADLVPPSTDPVPPSTNQYRPILTLYHQVPTSYAPNWPNTTKYQPVPLHTDPVSLSTDPDLKFVATVATGGRVKFLSAV